MKESFRKSLILFTTLLLTCAATFAQHGNPLQFFSNISQAAQTNPAFQNQTEKLVVGLPLIGGTSANWNANFAIADFHTNDFSFDFENFYNSLDEPGKAFSTAQTPLIYLSLKKKNNTFSFSIVERFYGLTDFDPEILNFYAQGLQPYYGKNEDIGSVSIKSQYFRAVSFGYANQIWKDLSIGIRPKILFGKLFYEADNVNLAVETILEEEKLLVIPEGDITISGPVEVVVEEENEYVSIKPDIKPSDYFLKPRNMGAAIDFGLTYNLDKQTEISLSIIDLGFTSIKYKAYTTSFTETLDYHKDNLYQSHDPEAPRYWSPQYASRTMSDSIPYITIVNDYSKQTLEPLPFQFNVQIKYKLPNNLQLGAANNYIYYKNHSSNFFSGFVQTHLSDKFEAVATISLYDFEKIMPGLGVNYSGQSVQYYLSTNNIIELIQTTSSKNLNLSFGVNFLFSVH